jgi:hypothetical protein
MSQLLRNVKNLQWCKAYVRGQFDELVLLGKLYNDELNDFLVILSMRTAERIVKFGTGGVTLNSYTSITVEGTLHEGMSFCLHVEYRSRNNRSVKL